MVDRERIELSISGCKPDVFPLALTAHETWYCIGVTIPSGHLERVETSPEVECSITGTVDGNQTRRDLIDSQISPSGGLYGITWQRCLGSNQE